MEAFKLVQLANAYSHSLFAYKTDGSPRPFSASFAVSNRCNISCAYCNCPNLDTKDLSLTEIEIIFSRLKKMGVRRLGLLGGEPLFRRDIIDIIALAKSLGFSVSMNTNLLLYEKFKNQLDSIDFFFTSLDGTPEKHAINRGKHSYEKVLAAIRDLVRRKKRIISICVVTDPDIANADYLLDVAERENIHIHFQPECYDAENVLRTAPPHQDQDGLHKFWKHLVKRKKEGARISSSLEYLKYISRWDNYAVSAYYDPDERCGAGRGFIYVDSNGLAYPCPYTKGSVEGVSLLTDEWRDKFNKATPCTKCIVGPMLEFNLLFQKPMASIVNALGNV